MTPRVPSVFASGRWSSADEVSARSRCWFAAAREAVGGGHAIVAVVVASSPDGVALFAAATGLSLPVIALGADPRLWRTDPPIPAGTVLLIPPALAHLSAEAVRIGCRPLVLPDDPEDEGDAVTPLRADGVVLFSSGSTGAPRAIFRPMQALVDGARARAQGVGLRSGDGIITGVSLASGQGLTLMISTLLLGGPLGLLDPVDHRAALVTLAMPEFRFWWASPHFAGALGRCRLTMPARAPDVCLVSSPIPRAVFDAFRDRFGVPLRQAYSSTETGPIAAESAPAAEVRHGTVGLPLPGVEVRVGPHPATPLRQGDTGRIWVRSRWQMAGYGFPPQVERPGDVDGWWPTRDLGRFDPDRRLVLAGRMDDCIRTRDGRLVDLAVVARSLREIGGVRDAAVVPFQGPWGSSFGAVLECDSSNDVAELQCDKVKLPPWAWPRKFAVVRSLPRLPNGKLDRRSCQALLAGA